MLMIVFVYDIDDVRNVNDGMDINDIMGYW